VIRGQQTTTTLSAGRGSYQCVTRARWLGLIALILCGPAVDGKPAPAAFDGVVSIADGDPFTIIRRDTLWSASKGVALIAGDLVETGPRAFLVVQAPEGTLIGLGPSTAVYFIERGKVATLFVLKGWVKADVKAAPTRVLGARLGIQGNQAVMLLYADERSNAAFDERGSMTIVLPDTAPTPVSKEPGPNHFFLRQNGLDVVSQVSPSVEFVEKMPLAFRDPLPAFPKLPGPVPPRELRAVTYSDIQAWLTIPRDWRRGFIGRFRGRLKDSAFFAAMDAHRALFPEWIPILHPPPAPESDGSTDESRTESKPKPHKSQSQQGDESR
jgi:hypothetical protein